jgi:hypothetical protein
VRLLPKEQQFYELFEEQAANLLKAAELLLKTLVEYNGTDTAYVRSKEIHEIEHAGDDMVHNILDRLNKSFITPLDREDLYALTRALDDILDWIDSSAERLVILRIEKATPHAVELARIIMRSSQEVAQAVGLLRNLRQVEPILRLCAGINQLENSADQVLREALASLFHGNKVDAVEVIKWKDIYENLEMATDKCEDVADIIQSVVVKYS